MEKKLLRRALREQTRLLSAADRQRLSAQLMEALRQHPRFQQARHLLLYHSLPDEPCTHALLDECLVWSPPRPRQPLLNTPHFTLNTQKEVWLPVVVGDDLEVRRYEGPAALQPAAFGIEEPTGERLTHLEMLDLIVVPGMAFTRQGERLGRGRGYYDRFLSQPALRGAYLLGICWPHALLESLPVEPHDVRVHEVIAL